MAFALNLKRPPSLRSLEFSTESHLFPSDTITLTLGPTPSASNLSPTGSPGRLGSGGVLIALESKLAESKTGIPLNFQGVEHPERRIMVTITRWRDRREKTFFIINFVFLFKISPAKRFAEIIIEPFRGGKVLQRHLHKIRPQTDFRIHFCHKVELFVG